MNAMPGASLASFAIRSSFVEMGMKLGVFGICLSNGSMIRRRPLLGGVPRDGSPASRSYCGAPTSRHPHRAHSHSLGSSAAFDAETSGSLRFLGNPPRHAMVSDPGGSATPGHRAQGPTRWRLGVAFRCYSMRRHPQRLIFRGSIAQPTTTLPKTFPFGPVRANRVE